MIKRVKQKVSATATANGSNDPHAAGGDASPYDLSMSHVPAGWVEAQGASPIGNIGAPTMATTARFSTMPSSSGSSFIPNVAALGASLATGTAWLLIDVQNIYSGPWIAILVGAIIALAIRITGLGEAPYKAMLALSAYLLTTLAVLILATRQDLATVYGSGYSFGDYEDTLIRTRFQDAAQLVAYGLGAIVAAVLAFGGRSHR